MPPRESNLSQYSVLIVDDDALGLDALAELLELHGMTVRTAQDGLEALMSLENFLPTLIITDLTMPRMSGWDLLKAVKDNRRTAHIPVIALSGHAMSIGKDKTMLVFDSYLTKPFSVEKLMNIIDIYFRG